MFSLERLYTSSPVEVSKSQTNIESEKFLSPEKMLGLKKNFGPKKNVGSEIFFMFLGPKKILSVNKILVPKKMMFEEVNLVKKMWSIKIKAHKNGVKKVW